MPRRQAAISLVVAVAVLLGLPPRGQADRLWGNASLSYEHISREDNGREQSDDITRESLILSYEDALFTKNRLRLTMNLQGRAFPFSDYHEYQPIFYADIKSYGYTFSARYSPYKRRSLAAGSNNFIDVYYRDFRGTASFTYDRWPTFTLIYNRLENFDRAEVRRYDAFNRNVVLESSFDRGVLSLRSNYNNLRRKSNLPGGVNSLTETYTATAGLSKAFSGLGYASTTYNFYDTRQSSNDVRIQDSKTHSVSSMLTVTAIPKLSLSGSYSGRFTEASRRETVFESDDQNMSARAEFQPAPYLSTFVGKGYQINSQAAGNSIVEYVSLGTSVTRYLRGGIDTRLSYNRTIFQQSSRIETIRDSTGAVIGTINNGDYSLDTYNASVNFVPRPFLKTYLDLTLSYNHDPINEDRRYQLTRSIDTRFTFSRSLEGRLTYTSLYQGSALKLDKAFSENYNVGLTYIPWPSLNLNATYIYSDFKGSAATTNSSFTGYVSYSFRRAFSLYVSINRREDTREQLIGGEVEKTQINPRSLNGQLLMHLSRKVTLSLAYVRNEHDSANGNDLRDESIQSVLTIQL